jgi:hypothetical protein
MTATDIFRFITQRSPIASAASTERMDQNYTNGGNACLTRHWHETALQQQRHCEERSDEAISIEGCIDWGLLRSA